MKYAELEEVYLNKKNLVLCVKVAISIAIIWYLFDSGRLTREMFSQLYNPRYISFAILAGTAFIAAQLLAALRLSLLLKMIGFNLSFKYIFKITMIGNLFNIVIPGVVGGDIVKGTYLFRIEEDRCGRSTGIVLMDRIIGFMALFFVGLVSLVYLYILKRDAMLPYINEFKAVIVISVGLLILFSFLVFFGKNHNFRTRSKTIASAFFKESFLYNVVHSMGTLAKSRRNLLYAFLISLCLQLIALAGQLVFVYLLPEERVDVITLAAASSVVWVLSIIPITPGNIGWTEFMASVGWSVVGSSSGASIFLYWRIVTVLFSLPGVLFFLHRIHDARLAERPDLIKEIK